MEKKLMSQVELPKYPFQIKHQSSILSLGSCFSDSIGQLLADLWFPIEINPFGTLFNPLSIAQLLERALNNEKYVLSDIQQAGEIHFLWDMHSRNSDLDPENVLQKANEAIEKTNRFLKHGDLLILTFGTAYYFELKKEKLVVGNCHKQAQSLFERKKADTAEIVKIYTKLFRKIREINPKIQFLITVSPVRHFRDGFISNNRSKSTLLLATEELEKEAAVFYFPSYEIQVDELRDYRFYESDLIHPNSLAVNIIFEYFKKAFFDLTTKDYVEKIQKINAQEEHRPLFPNSIETKRAQEKLKAKKRDLQRKIFE